MSLFTRSAANPILRPNPDHPWESLKTYNPGAICIGRKYHLFYRAVGSGTDWHSVIGHAVSSDGISFCCDQVPILDRSDRSESRGLEDPRIVRIDDTYFLSYAAYDGKVPRIGLAKSEDLTHWEKIGPVFPEFPFFRLGGFRVRWKDGVPEKYCLPDGKYDRTKSAGIFPEKIDGKYWMIFNEYLMWMANSVDGIHWRYEPKPFLTPREGDYFDNVFVEMGPPPIKTEKGWLVLYHGVDATYTYAVGLLLLDLKNPSNILYRSDRPVFLPEMEYEIHGLVDKLSDREKHAVMSEGERQAYLSSVSEKEVVPKVVFCNGAVVIGDTLRLYYGAGDMYIGTATASLHEVLKLLP